MKKLLLLAVCFNSLHGMNDAYKEVEQAHKHLLYIKESLLLVDQKWSSLSAQLTQVHIHYDKTKEKRALSELKLCYDVLCAFHYFKTKIEEELGETFEAIVPLDFNYSALLLKRDSKIAQKREKRRLERELFDRTKKKRFHKQCNYHSRV